METRSFWCLAIFVVLAVASHCSEARTHNVHRRAAEHDPDSSNANYEDQALADAAFGDDTQNDAEGDDEEEDVNATILSQGEEFKVGIGKTVRLPCTIEPSPKVKESVAFKWSRDGQDYFFGSMRVGAPERLHIDNDTTTDLFITDLLPSDSGSYRCDIVKEASKTGEVQKPVFVEHTIRVEAPPKINEISATNRGQVVEGTEVQITCVVSGSPPPKIIWSKEEASGDSHALSENGTMYSPNSLTIKSVQREHAGKYICLADNRVGNPAVAFIKLQVLGKPRVHVHKSIINSEPNVAVVLQCAAHEEPPTEITWFKDQSLIQQYSARKTLVTLGQHSNLTVIPETDADFGTFTCQAENQYGKHERSIQLVQTPVIEELDVDGPKLSFNVHSHQMLLAVQLLIRAMNQDTSETQTIHLTVPEGSHHEYPMSFEFKGILAPGKYEVQVQAQNTYDWGQADPVVVDIETQPDSVIQHDSETQPESVIQPASVFRGAAHSTRTETALIASLIMYLFVRML